MQYIYRKWLKLANSEEAFDRDDWRFLLTFDGDRPKEQLVHAVFEPLPTGEQMADKFCALFLRDKAASKKKRQRRTLLASDEGLSEEPAIID